MRTGKGKGGGGKDLDYTNTADVLSAGDDAYVAHLKLGETNDLVGGNINLDGVPDLNEGIGVADGAAVVGDDIGNLAGASAEPLDAAKLEFSLLRGDPVEDEASLGIVEHAEVLAGLLNADDVHEAAGISHVSADLAVNLDGAAVHDHLGLGVGERILQPVAEDDEHGDALAKLVRTSRRARSKHARQLVKHPVLGRRDALQVLPRTTRHFLLQYTQPQPNRKCQESITKYLPTR
jgi:hypothetical protein